MSSYLVKNGIVVANLTAADAESFQNRGIKRVLASSEVSSDALNAK